MEKLFSFILSDYNAIYLYSILIMFCIFILELVSMLGGFHISSFIDDAFPDFDLDADLDVDIEIDGGVPFHHVLLSWFNLGKVPFLVLVIIFLTAFGLTGFIAQYLTITLIKINIPSLILILADLIFSFYVLHKIGGFVGRIIPSEETSAVSQESFIGRIAVITTGTSKRGMPAQAKIKDEHGRFHYVMTEPLNDEDEFDQGFQVVIVDKKGRNYLVDAFDIN